MPVSKTATVTPEPEYPAERNVDAPVSIVETGYVGVIGVGVGVDDFVSLEPPPAQPTKTEEINKTLGSSSVYIIG